MEEGDIDANNWKRVRRLEKLHGWNFVKQCPNWHIAEEIEFLCNGCYDLWCFACKSIDDCKKRCLICNAPCSNACTCE